MSTVLLLACAPAPSGESRLLGRVEHVADGDTLSLAADAGRVRVRLFQIDAPEQDQPGGSAARRALADKVDGKYVRVEIETLDDYGRVVGRVRLGERDINRELVREGHAWAYRHYLQDRTLLDDEAAARRAGLGLWARADPVAPWAWRRGARPDPAGVPAAGRDCAIKGNINRGGARIYHRPGDESYPQTRIDPARGERWFCTEAEARQAGWRAARR